eukprot:TRINITY_DN29021_c0_g2_i1.p1 TRINITY_DN29021_c0_g2~~TRINITY_DN29021_c0_g2_i1.p1  ORF type:complete len:465 (-),score=91.65 TRINITY_DN29021_c0_g2_i1:190-1485(-)
MLADDAIVARYPQYLPTEEEIDLAARLLQRPEFATLRTQLHQHVAIAGCARSALRRFCWQAREDHKVGEECAQEALQWLRRCVENRQRLRMDIVLQTECPFSAEFRELYISTVPFSFHGTDRQGHPVLISRYGSVDVAALRRLWAEGEALQRRANLGVNGAVLYHLRAMEYLTKVVMAEESARQGRIVDRILVIVDLNGLGLRHLDACLKGFLGSTSRESVPLFPETLHATVVANVPWVVAKALWPLGKKLLHPVTQDKFMFTASANDLRATLDKLIPHEQIPPYLGGACRCAECASGSLHGGSLRDWEERQGLYPSTSSRSTPSLARASARPARSGGLLACCCWERPERAAGLGADGSRSCNGASAVAGFGAPAAVSVGGAGSALQAAAKGSERRRGLLATAALFVLPALLLLLLAAGPFAFGGGPSVVP